MTEEQRKDADIARFMEWLDHKRWTYRLRAPVALEQRLRDNPAELIDIAVSMLDNEHPAVRKKASKILQRIEGNK